MSTNTRELVVEEGGFEYDSDCYSDDLPYWTKHPRHGHLVVPYSLVVNDARYIVGTGYGSRKTSSRPRRRPSTGCGTTATTSAG